MAESTPTQYDAIGQAYESMKRLPGALVERDNLHAAVAPYIKNATVLDLACGTGYYSRLLLEWGASGVVGVDISPAMIFAAKEASSAQNISSEKLTFLVGNAMKPLVPLLEEFGQFDIVLGAWLLNYAPSAIKMTTMFRNISCSLKPGGVFVGITPHPAADLDIFAELHSTEQAKASMKKFGVSIEYLSALENGEGYNTRVTGHTSPKEISFENFHLRREEYETAAGEKGGMSERVQWKEVELPDEEKSREFGVGKGYWEGFNERPHFGILVVEK